MDNPIVAANWKMNMTKNAAKSLITKLNSYVIDRKVKVIIMPPFTLLDVASSIIAETIELGAQNCYYKKSGAFTGEISPEMLIDIGCRYVIIGHSERRHIFGENNALLHKKLIAAEKAGLTAIYCVGETLDEKADKELILQKQLSIISDLAMPPIIAYEPVWAIGTGIAADIATIRETVGLIRLKLKEQGIEKVSVLYGGSVKPNNIKEISSEETIDGVLVGGASLDADSFLQIIESFKR